MIKSVKLLLFVLLPFLLIMTGGCATSRIPTGPDTFSTLQFDDQPKLGILKVQDERQEKKAGNIGLAIINVESDESLFANFYNLFVLVPTICTGVRRMHDVDKSGWCLLIPIYNLILLVKEGTVGVNRFGSDPKQ